jgi:hypothetical protein
LVFAGVKNTNAGEVRPAARTNWLHPQGLVSGVTARQTRHPLQPTGISSLLRCLHSNKLYARTVLYSRKIPALQYNVMCFESSDPYTD